MYTNYENNNEDDEEKAMRKEILRLQLEQARAGLATAQAKERQADVGSGCANFFGFIIFAFIAIFLLGTCSIM